MRVYDQEDTIAAISTPPGEGGIGIIRISGTLSLHTALKIFRKKRPQTKLKSHRLYYGDIFDPSDGAIVDEAMLSYMKAPNSFTNEDVVELNCHSGTVVLQKVMELLLREGIREAAPGEFTKRAFLNGRIELSQAEAVIDVIRAKTDRGLRLAQYQLKGGLRDHLKGVREDLIYALAVFETYIDFPEEDIEEAALGEVKKKLTVAKKEIECLLGTYDEGRVQREGIYIVIAGRPNVGKSSLLNVLLKEKRAIVTSIAGTTRDVIEEVVNIKGIPANLIDTAGIRETDDIIEGEGIKRTREKLKEADIVLYMIDEGGFHHKEKESLDEIGPGRILIIINKIDIISEEKTKEIEKKAGNIPMIRISAKDGEGIGRLKEVIFETVTHHGIDTTQSVVISRKRHKIALESAIEDIKRAIEETEGEVSYELIAADLREALMRIGEMAGETTTEDVLDKIFSEFCIGK